MTKNQSSNTDNTKNEAMLVATSSGFEKELTQLEVLSHEYNSACLEYHQAEKNHQSAIEAKEQSSREENMLLTEWEKRFNQSNGVLSADLRKLREKITVIKDLNNSYPDLIQKNEYAEQMALHGLAVVSEKLSRSKNNFLRQYTLSVLKKRLAEASDIIGDALRDFSHATGLATKAEREDAYNYDAQFVDDEKKGTKKTEAEKIINDWVRGILFKNNEHYIGDPLISYVNKISEYADYYEQFKLSPAKLNKIYMNRAR
ncbi:hypothetical protein PTR77_08530 [Serratia bockelmannii]|uniref:hypothetical protein n=1 Tax=Serratia bockelmannii TaxID=2703793 RepID=UPI00313C7F5B